MLTPSEAVIEAEMLLPFMRSPRDRNFLPRPNHFISIYLYLYLLLRYLLHKTLHSTVKSRTDNCKVLYYHIKFFKRSGFGTFVSYNKFIIISALNNVDYNQSKNPFLHQIHQILQ